MSKNKKHRKGTTQRSKGKVRTKRSRAKIRKKGRTTKQTRPSIVCRQGTFIDASVIPSPYSVFVVVFVMQNDEPIKLIKFETDVNVIRSTIEFVTSGRYFRSDPKVNVHPQLVSMIMDPNEPKDELHTIIINYISYFEAEGALNAFPDQSIGYFLYFDVDDYTNGTLEAGLKHDMEEMFNAVIGYNTLIA